MDFLYTCLSCDNLLSYIKYNLIMSLGSLALKNLFRREKCYAKYKQKNVINALPYEN